MTTTPDVPEPDDYDPWAGPQTSLLGRYEGDAARLEFAPCINHEVAIEIGGRDQLFVDALDLLRVVSHVVLNLTYEPSPTESPRFQAQRLDDTEGGDRS